MDNYNYGIIGNCTSGALISSEGSIDWLCLPKFDSSSVFAKILDNEKGGTFSIEMEGLVTTSQEYIPRTNMLCTHFYCCNSQFDIIDFMPRFLRKEHYYCPPDVIRYFKIIKGNPKIKIKYHPKLEYAQYNTKTEELEEYLCSYTEKGRHDSIYLYTDFDKQDILKENIITLTKDQFVLISYNQKLLEQNLKRIQLKMEWTKVYWMSWSERTKSYTKYNDQILRSALTLKLLSSQKSGAIIAALTTSLPESIGEIRNWDYRFCWIRDGSMVVKILTELGHSSTAKRYMRFILSLIPDKDESFQVLYGINGEKKLEEHIISNLSGYENSYPVRVGNAAYKQKQNDIYGILMDEIYHHVEKFSNSISYSEDLWTVVRNIVRQVKKNWRNPDKGIWEIRTESKHFTFSKVLCWTAIDRAQKIAELFGRDFFSKKWKELANTIHKDIEKNAWNEKKQAFTQSYGSDDMDAAVLLLLQYGFIDARDPRYISTVHAIERELKYKGLMYRYKSKDDFGIPKSSFTVCSFWLANSLYKIGEKERGIKLFEELSSYGNHLGLFGEDLDFVTKRQLGNFPQAYSHLALIEAAISISENKVTNETKIMDAIS